MKRAFLLIGLMHILFTAKAQIVNTNITLTSTFDQIKFEPPGLNRYFFMSKPASSIAFGQYSPDDGGWFTYWKTGSGDMIVNKGKVGIGTSSPNALLDIKGAETNFEIGNRNIKLNTNDTNAFPYYPWIGFYTNGVRGAFIGYGQTGKRLDFRLENNVNLAIIGGNVGIGKTTPKAKLHVDGNIISEEVKVEDVIPADFVFEPDYNLSTLAETEAYIKAHKHLPEIPSAAEMEANGLELGKMNMLLLQKIEELTLHIIKQNKRIEQLESKSNY